MYEKPPMKTINKPTGIAIVTQNNEKLLKYNNFFSSMYKLYTQKEKGP